MKYAPIALFVYKRPDHVRRAIQSLMECPEFSESKIIVYCDGPRTEKDTAAVNAAREVAKNLLGECARYVVSEQNRGLAASVIAGVTELCENYGRVIVVEDDLIVAPGFLTFLNAALDRYEYEERVMQVSGHMFPVPELQNNSMALFLPFVTSWGWATWQRAWNYFDKTANGWESLQQDKSLRKKFNMLGSYDYYGMLISQIRGKVDSWAIRWNWSVFKRDGLVLYPPKSLVKNTGLDGSGTHGGHAVRRALEVDASVCGLFEFPKPVEVDAEKYRVVRCSVEKLKEGWLTYSVKRVFNALFG